MASSAATILPGLRQPAQGDDLLLRETNHRCSNDLQLVVSLLGLQSRRAANPEVREALSGAMERVSILARARSAMYRERQQSLDAALRQVCEALQSQSEPRSILISMSSEHDVEGLSSRQITTLALAVNELATNAIKHAFEEGKSGTIHITVRRTGSREVVILVDDDGLPFPEIANGRADGLGLDLVRRLVASIGGMLIPPDGSKCFELRVPIAGE